MSLFIFIPGETSPNPKRLGEMGLASLLSPREPGPEAIALHSGPDRKAGMMFLWRQAGVEVSHTPDSKTWLPWIEEEGETAEPTWYLGLEKDFDPRQLARSRQIDGLHVVMGDGNSWQFPSADHLPMRHKLIGGKHRRIVVGELKEYAAECDRMRAVACKACGIADTGEDTQFCFEEADAFVCRALAINYRVTPQIVDLLGLLNDETMVRGIFAAVNLPAVVRATQEGEVQEHKVRVVLA